MKKLLLSATSLALLAGTALAADLPSRKAAQVYAPPVQTWSGFYAGLNAGYNAGTNGNASMANYAGPWTTKPGGGNVEYGTGAGNSWTVPMSPVMFVFPRGLGGQWYPDWTGQPGYPVIVTLGATQGSSGGGGGLLGAGGSDRNTQSGFIGGGQIGYNYQYGSSIVIGVEADIQGAGIRGTTTGSGASQSVLQTPLVGAPNAGTITSGVSAVAVQGGVDWLGTVRGRLGYLVTPTLLLYGSGGLAYTGHRH
jgi:outer membrane immunogenic protein